MQIIHDSHYTIGSTHQYCQDYADSGDRGNFIYACISDGCSSSKDSDIGARWLCKDFPRGILANERYLNDPLFTDKVEHWLACGIREQGISLFDMPSFDATLLGLFYDKTSDRLFIHAWGDGRVMVKYKSGNVVLFNISYKTNAPYYLSYRLNGRTEQYEKEFGVEYATVRETFNYAETEFFHMEQKRFFRIIPDASKVLDFAAVMSDGVESFLPDGASKQLAQQEFLNFKSLNGEFVKRRFQGFKKYCAKNNTTHYDDLSLAAISFID